MEQILGSKIKFQNWVLKHHFTQPSRDHSVRSGSTSRRYVCIRLVWIRSVCKRSVWIRSVWWCWCYSGEWVIFDGVTVKHWRNLISQRARNFPRLQGSLVWELPFGHLKIPCQFQNFSIRGYPKSHHWEILTTLARAFNFEVYCAKLIETKFLNKRLFAVSRIWVTNGYFRGLRNFKN